MAKFQHALDPGSRVENYEIRRVLGIGGFGVTYQATDLQLNCVVALKEYLPSGLAIRDGNSSQVTPKSEDEKDLFNRGLKRFLDEAQTLAKFKLPSIVRINRFLEANGTAYIVMDYEEGLPLSNYIRKRKTLTEKEIRSVILPILTGLRSVHTHGILHRDIKPANIYLRKQGLPVLLDFGAARQELQQNSRPMTGMVTPGYAPFEQYNNRDKQGPWTDLYGVGATLYHCVTGNIPPPSPDRISASQNHDADPLKHAHTAAKSGYSDALLSSIDWMLNLQPKNRPQSVDEILGMLSPIKKNTGTDTASPVELGDVGQTFMLDNLDAKLDDWDPAVLDQAEKELAPYVGPMAKVLVNQYAENAIDIQALYTALAMEIEKSVDQQAYIRLGELASLTTGPRTTGTRSASQNSTGGNTTRSNATKINPNVPHVPGRATIEWDHNILKYAEKELAKFVGPMARILVSQAAEQSENIDELVQILSEDIPSQEEKRSFAKSLANFS